MQIVTKKEMETILKHLPEADKIDGCSMMIPLLMFSEELEHYDPRYLRILVYKTVVVRLRPVVERLWSPMLKAYFDHRVMTWDLSEFAVV